MQLEDQSSTQFAVGDKLELLYGEMSLVILGEQLLTLTIPGCQ